MKPRTKRSTSVTIAADNPTFILDEEDGEVVENGGHPTENNIAPSIITDKTLKSSSTVPTVDHEYFDKKMRKVKLNLLKKLVLTSVGFLGVMAMYDMLRYLESSLNSEEGLGTLALAANYATMIPSLLFAPALVIKKIGLKSTFILAALLFNTFFVAHYYPTFYTLLPGAMVTGFGYGLLEITANCIVTELSISYASATKRKVSGIINRFFGLFVMTTYTGKIWGNLISSFLLEGAGPKLDIPEAQLAICGVHYCNQPLGIYSKFYENVTFYKNGTASENGTGEMNVTTFIATTENSSLKPTDLKAYIMYSVCIGMSVVVAITIAFGFDKKPIKPRRDSVINQPIGTHLLGTFKLMREPDLLLLIPLTMMLGLADAFTSSDVTQAFITCSFGIHQIGLMMVVYGCTASFMSCVAGWLANHVGRPPILLTSTTIDLSIYSFLIYWQPDPSKPYMYYVITGIFGLSDGIWKTQIYALYGDIFRRKAEAGFANLEIWQALGFVLGYAWHGSICMYVKLVILIAFIVSGILGYSVVEFRQRRKIKEQKEKFNETSTHM